MLRPPTLQPLRIPAGWTVAYNEFTSSNAHDDLKEDLLQLRHEIKNLLVDLGWYPEGDQNGSYLLLLFEGDFEGTCLAEFRSVNREEIVEVLERLLKSTPLELGGR